MPKKRLKINLPMGNNILMLDGPLSSPSLSIYIAKALGRRVDLVHDIPAVRGLLSSSANHSVVLVDPMVSYESPMRAFLYDFLSREVRQDNGLPVVLYTMHSPANVLRDFGLREGRHFDAYVSKVAGQDVDLASLRLALDRVELRESTQ
jgi:hypothetical protein